MTLVTGMSKADGIYLSCDYRVTAKGSGRILDDAALKMLHVEYPPMDQGPRLLMAFTGLAVLPDGTPVGRWLRETLRGETEVIDASMAHLRARLDRDIAPLRVELMINALIVHGERRYLGGFTNVKQATPTQTTVVSSFTYWMRELTKPFFFSNGSGGSRALADKKMELIRSQLIIRPRQPLDHMRMLAEINRRVAALERTVSPFCQVAFLNGDDRSSPQTQAFVEKGESVPFEMPIVLLGIDLTDSARRSNEAFQARLRGEEPQEFDVDEINAGLKRRP